MIRFLIFLLLFGFGKGETQAQPVSLGPRWAPVIQTALPLAQTGLPRVDSLSIPVAKNLGQLDFSNLYAHRVLMPVSQLLENHRLTPEKFCGLAPEKQGRLLRKAIEMVAAESNRRAQEIVTDFRHDIEDPQRIIQNAEDADRILIFEFPYLTDENRSMLTRAHSIIESRASEVRERGLNQKLEKEAQAVREEFGLDSSGPVREKVEAEFFGDAPRDNIFRSHFKKANEYLSHIRSSALEYFTKEKDRGLRSMRIGSWRRVEQLLDLAAMEGSGFSLELVSRRLSQLNFKFLLKLYTNYVKEDSNLNTQQRFDNYRFAVGLSIFMDRIGSEDMDAQKWADQLTRFANASDPDSSGSEKDSERQKFPKMEELVVNLRPHVMEYIKRNESFSDRDRISKEILWIRLEEIVYLSAAAIDGVGLNLQWIAEQLKDENIQSLLAESVMFGLQEPSRATKNLKVQADELSALLKNL
ncbi:MAG: hypothetical protein HY399_01490 [Elusimicrobia bacterium]|nr:hypothetical protein [Elusimicrobiota bacterium]